MNIMTTVTLPEALSFIVDNRGRTCPTASEGLPLIATNCLKPGKRSPVFENVRYVDDATYRSWFRAHPEPGDVLFVCKGSPGRMAVVPDPVPFCIAQDMVALRADPAVVNPTYLYYRLSAPDVQASIGNMHVGTMIPHFKKGDFGKLKFTIHSSLSEQQAIAELLSAVDDKIAANEAALCIQLTLAEAYLSGALTQGSQIVALGDVAEIHNRRRVPLSSREREARRGQVPYYGAASRMGFVDEAIFDQPLLLIGEDGTVVRDDGGPVTQYIWGPAWVNNHAHVVTGRGISTELLRVAVRQSNVAHLVTGAVQPKLNMGNLRTLELKLPSSGEEVDRRIQSLAHAERALVDESRRLASTRDELLPLLMSGNLRVKDAEGVL